MPEDDGWNLQDVGRMVITGAAGFIGSSLALRLLEQGKQVVGLDSFEPNYDKAQKLSNLANLSAWENFSFEEADLSSTDLEGKLEEDDIVFHLAAQPGVRESWVEFERYLRLNVLMTSRLLEECKRVQIRRLVFASSSSVYGQNEGRPSSEGDVCKPYSPYGVSKLAAECLVTAYARNFGLSTVSLRYFTVYGPRQRPDMAIHRMIRAGMEGTPFTIFGDGSHVRDFTYVDDVVSANVFVATAPSLPAGAVYNVCGGAQVSVRDLVVAVRSAVGRLEIRHAAQVPGDVQRTSGDSSLLRMSTGWSPQVELKNGLEQEVRWLETELSRQC